MAKKERVLLFDPGPQIGDNCRAFILFKAFRLAHPELEIDCWLTPEVEVRLGDLLQGSGAVDRLVVAPRTPRQTFQTSFELVKMIIGAGREWFWSECPPGKGPDGREYDRIIPTGEPWLTAKLLREEDLEAPERINQGRFLADLLGLSRDQAAEALPLFEDRARAFPAEPVFVTVGLGRPEKDDPKQLPAERQTRIWEVIRTAGVRAVAVDYQDHTPPPESDLITDLRSAGLAEKVGVFNQARAHIGSDGGLVHFAAACGCPTIGFYAGPQDRSGHIFGPWPRFTGRGDHTYCHRFDEFEQEVRRLMEELGG